MATAMDVEEINPDQEIDFCTLGMFILDEIQYPPPQPPQHNILGGAGTYSALGARLASPAPHLSKKVGWIVDRGSDFPPSQTSHLNTWQTSCLLRTDPTRLTTRALNSYSSPTDPQHRAFRYTTPKLRLEHHDLLDSPALLHAKSFHLICSPSRCISLVTNILSLRRQTLYPLSPPKPLFIWEPVPDCCLPTELLATTAALGYVDICSPNHSELGTLMSSPASLPDGSVDRTFVEDAAEMLLASMPLSAVAIIVRCGADGCYIAQNGGRSAPTHPRPTPSSNSNFASPPPLPPKKAKKIRGGGLALTADIDMMSLFADIPSSPTSTSPTSSEPGEDDDISTRDFGLSSWLPAYHTNSAKVIDPTGGGNAFLGALTITHARGAGLEEAARWGNVAASLAIEQVGMPVLSFDEKGGERWNGVDVGERMRELEGRGGGGDEGLAGRMAGVSI
ncbi:hypothetical protein VE01_10257 [Pseudogymnoascus verrucosus]|uniref:Carbohydrate kinase PfkB domain-containing protein n=1 Tax=Pseudogymnoascus verrucosus TaxID=342668 RepID=A0A1B8G7A1_9PEZI|nr:uncharacterized protein VE01_10257 [Pseudogymnoascus verrucosus]OBT91705.1 hypothetical protein VE01_10257 [Pseudogymnoascus verrucosus]